MTDGCIERTDWTATGLIVLAIFALVACSWGLDNGPPLGDHEAIVAQCARQIRQSGRWLIPRFNDVPFIRKPPLQPWLVAVSSYIVDPAGLSPPVSPVAARFPSALAGVVTVLVVFGLARSMFSGRTALVAGGITACCGGTLFFSHNAQAEMVLTLFTTVAMTCFYRGIVDVSSRRKYLVGFYVCLSLAMLAKAPLPLAIVGLPLFAYWFVTLPLADAINRDEGAGGLVSVFMAGMLNQLIRLRELWLLPGVVLFLVPFHIEGFRVLGRCL